MTRMEPKAAGAGLNKKVMDFRIKYVSPVRSCFEIQALNKPPCETCQISTLSFHSVIPSVIHSEFFHQSAGVLTATHSVSCLVKTKYSCVITWSPCQIRRLCCCLSQENISIIIHVLLSLSWTLEKNPDMIVFVSGHDEVVPDLASVDIHHDTLDEIK